MPANSAGRCTRPPADPDGAKQSRYSKYIKPSEQAPELTATDKVVIGFRDSATGFSVLDWIAVAGYEQARDSAPNYGTDGTAYLQRVGAAAARSTSKGIFTAAVFAPLFHEDPRYYKVGPSRGVAYRLLYAGSRIFVTKRDDGTSTVNRAALAGDLAGTALSQVYYPPQNRGFGVLARSYGIAIAGSMLTFSFDEFLTETLDFLHVSPSFGPH